MIKELIEKIKIANEEYRIGSPIISDSEYDSLIDSLKILDPNNDLLNNVGHSILDKSRKAKLPIEMASMSKLKTIEDIHDWCRLKGISQNEDVIITPKFDGLSLCVDERTNASYTRGDGVFGQKSDEHYKLLNNKLYSNLEGIEMLSPLPFNFTYGEIMMPKSVFLSKYSEDFANPRNFVAGLLNSPEPREPLKDCQYIKYGAVIAKGHSFNTKQDILDELNYGQSEKVDYSVYRLSDLTEDLLIDLFHKYSTNYEIDGLIIEINSLSLQEQLGRETSSGNPVWARAFKHSSFEQLAETDVIGISWNISKQGYLKPILHVSPIKLDGVTVSNVTGNNARYVKDMGLGIGSKVKIVRSGMVIPKIVDVIERVDFVMPSIPNIGWSDNEIELITLSETDEQRFKQVVSFFEILETDSFGEGVIRQLWENGHKTIKDILNLSKEDLEKIDRFGKRKAQIVWNAIRRSTIEVSLSKLQHATGLFPSLGSKKLILLEHFKEKPGIDQVMEIDGFAELSAKNYVDNYDKFFSFIKDLPISIKEKVESIKSSNNFDGMVFVFTGVRRVDLEEKIEQMSGKIGSSVSKNTTHLVMKEVGSGSSKEKKAIELGIKILTINQLEQLINENI